ncbi:hypothetical protein [Acidianus sp. HS-5]|uniref:hypothetical protein n=1 Tax=Acidianus sp. HS-5 TaxID=2886040 RepID=UPI001F3B0A4E|nr:hypothetical protein [Acidianus sp. HS-5]BDC17741.1 hypothetical protein HS5_06310 [Acidianus sp. HS-5]
MEKDLIEESRKIAEKIIKSQFRLTLAKYYLLWATFPLILYLLFYFNTAYPFLNYPIAVIGYLYYTFKIFSDLSKTVRRIEGARKPKMNKKFVIIYNSIWAIATALVIIGSDFDHPYLVLVGAVLFGGNYAWFIYLLLKKNTRDLHYYDSIAFIAFIGMLISIGICVSLNIPVFRITWVPYTLAWIYASYASYMEVIEGE